MVDDLNLFLLIVSGVFILLLVFSWSKRNRLSGREWYQEQLQKPEWKQRRLEILQRDHFRCQVCLSDNLPQVHHKSYWTGRKPWEYPDWMLITMCKNCHTLFSQSIQNQPDRRQSNFKAS